mmetsp:Transcript_7172/g.21011  ORF Transcript_7172/g.21011 Transcript_7172/m.21011 type:complete len:236 (-) Transcript_7172:588-1295(-)
MHDVPAVAVRHRRQELLRVPSRLALGEVRVVAARDELEEVFVAPLEHEVYFEGLVEERLLEHSEDLDDVALGASDVLEDRDLSRQIRRVGLGVNLALALDVTLEAVRLATVRRARERRATLRRHVDPRETQLAQHGAGLPVRAIVDASSSRMQLRPVVGTSVFFGRRPAFRCGGARNTAHSPWPWLGVLLRQASNCDSGGRASCRQTHTNSDSLGRVGWVCSELLCALGRGSRLV